MIPILKASLPDHSVLAKYIQEIDKNRVYSNFGPLHNRLIKKIAQFYVVDETNLALVSSGTAALMSVIMFYKYHASKGNSSEFKIIVPNWTFSATVQAVISLGCVPVLLDVDANTGLLSIDAINTYLSEGGHCDMIIPVVPFGNQINLDTWQELSDTWHIPCCVDGAAGFFSIKPCRMPICVSMHATKGISTAEGGFVLSTDCTLIEGIRPASNFGFSNKREPSQIGINLKLSEYNAALGLASLDCASTFSSCYAEQYQLYVDLITQELSPSFRVFTDEYPKTTFSMINNSSVPNKELTFRLLTEYGIESRSWWGKPLSLTAISDYCEFPYPCPSSLELSNKNIAIPIGEHVDAMTQKYIIQSIKNIA